MCPYSLGSAQTKGYGISTKFKPIPCHPKLFGQPLALDRVEESKKQFLRYFNPKGDELSHDVLIDKCYHGHIYTDNGVIIPEGGGFGYHGLASDSV